MDFMPCVEDAGKNFLFVETQIDAEIIAVARQDFRGDDLRAVILRVMVVILDESESLRERRARDENGADPVMDHPAGHRDWFAIIESGQFFNYDFARAERGEVRGMPRRRQCVDPEKRSRVAGGWIE